MTFYEEKYENLKKEYKTIVRSSGSTHPYYRNKYFNDYVDGRPLNMKKLESIGHNMNVNTKNNNKLYHSSDKLYDTKGKNNFKTLDKKLHEYNPYNYNMILNCIETKLKDIKNNKINDKAKTIHKINSDFDIKRNERNICCFNTKHSDKKYSRYIRVRNILEEIKDGINSIKNQNYQRKKLRFVFSEDNLL